MGANRITIVAATGAAGIATLSVMAVMSEGLEAGQNEALTLERLRAHVGRAHNHVADHKGELPQARAGDRLDLAPPRADSASIEPIANMRQTVGLWPAVLRDYFDDQPRYPELYSPGLVADANAMWDLGPGPVEATGPGGWPSFQWNHYILTNETSHLDDFRRPSQTCLLIDRDVAYLSDDERSLRRAGGFADGHAETKSDEEWEAALKIGSPRRFSDER